MCTCGPSKPCEQTAAQHCSAVLLRITPQSKTTCLHTLRAYLAHRSLPVVCRLDPESIFTLLCTPVLKTGDGLFEHHYEAVCTTVAEAYASFVDVSTLLIERGQCLTATSFRFFCETVPKLSKRVFFHPVKRDFVCARGAFNVYDKPSMISGVKHAGSYGLSLTALGAAYPSVGEDVQWAIRDCQFVIIAGRVYSTEVAPLAVSGALEVWTEGLPASLRPRRS